MFNHKSAFLEVEASPLKTEILTQFWPFLMYLKYFDLEPSYNNKNYIFMIRKICSIDSNQFWTVLIFHQIFQNLLQPFFTNNPINAASKCMILKFSDHSVAFYSPFCNFIKFQNSFKTITYMNEYIQSFRPLISIFWLILSIYSQFCLNFYLYTCLCVTSKEEGKVMLMRNFVVL